MTTLTYIPATIISRNGNVLGILSPALTLSLCLPLGVWSLPLSADIKVTFAPQTQFAVGHHPYSVATADFNGDGHTDLVTTNFYPHTVSVLLGNGNGGFGAQTPFAVGSVPYSVATADFNGDGHTDLVTANVESDNVSVLLGNGRGGFGAQTPFAVGDRRPYSVATADFNGDGHTDLVAAHLSSAKVSVLLGNGSGGFGAPTLFAAGRYPYSVTTADFNADGHTDLVTANFTSNNVSVLRGNGSGGFGAPTHFAVGHYPSSVDTADFNGDGHTDLVTASSYSNNVSVLLGDGSDGFGAPTLFAVGDSPYSVTTADFNGDGHTDLVAANAESDTVSVLLGNGRGRFGAPTHFAAGRYPYSVATADFNADGKTDLVTTNALYSKVSLLLNTTTPFLFTSLPDIDGDGRPEIAAVLYDIALHKATAQVKNANTGALVKQINFNGQFVPQRLAAMPDLNANGAAEIAVLGIRDSDHAVQVEIRDSLSGAELSAVPFPATFPPIGLSLLRDSSCGSKVCLAVLQQNETALRAQIKDALTGTPIRNIQFSGGLNGKGLGLISDLNGNKKREFALLADAKTPGAAYQVEIRDSKSGVLIRTISFPAGEPVRGLLNLADLNQNQGTDLASLLPHIPQIMVVDTQTGATLNTIATTLTKPFMLSTEADTGSDNDVAILGVRPSDGKNVAEVYDSLTGAVVHSIQFSSIGATVAFRRIADVNGNGSSELIRLREQAGSPQFVAEIRDGATGLLINTIDF